MDLIFNVHILGLWMHICARYEVSMMKAVTRTAVHRCCQHECRCGHGRQHHTTDRAWLHRLITKWAKKYKMWKPHNFKNTVHSIIILSVCSLGTPRIETLRCCHVENHTRWSHNHEVMWFPREVQDNDAHIGIRGT